MEALRQASYNNWTLTLTHTHAVISATMHRPIYISAERDEPEPWSLLTNTRALRSFWYFISAELLWFYFYFPLSLLLDRFIVVYYERANALKSNALIIEYIANDCLLCHVQLHARCALNRKNEMKSNFDGNQICTKNGKKEPQPQLRKYTKQQRRGFCFSFSPLILFCYFFLLFFVYFNYVCVRNRERGRESGIAWRQWRQHTLTTIEYSRTTFLIYHSRPRGYAGRWIFFPCSVCTSIARRE